MGIVGFLGEMGMWMCEMSAMVKSGSKPETGPLIFISVVRVSRRRAFEFLARFGDYICCDLLKTRDYAESSFDTAHLILDFLLISKMTQIA
jgi:hypothetical protein